MLRSYFVGHVGLELGGASIKGKDQLGVKYDSGSNYQSVRSKLKLNTKSIAVFVEIYIYKRFVLRDVYDVRDVCDSRNRRKCRKCRKHALGSLGRHC